MTKSILGAVTSLFGMTDEQAMLRVQADGDAQAFAQLMRRWETPIQRLCTRMLGDPHRAEDLTQDTFARLFAKRKDYQPTGRFSTFLWRIAMNLCYDELRRMKRRPESPLELVETDDQDGALPFRVLDPAPDRALADREQGEIIREAVQQLSEAYRSVVILRHYENLKFREIAEVLGIPEGTVKSRMAEALDQLHRTISQTLTDNPRTLCKTQAKPREASLVL